MANKKLLKKVAPVVLSVAMTMSSMPAAAMAADFSDSDVVSADVAEAEDTTEEAAADVEVDTEEPEEDTADVEISEEETDNIADADADAASSGDVETEFTSEEQEFSDGDENAEEYKYVYAGLTWEQYWAAEGVYEATNTSSSDVKDRHNEYDLGGFDTVTRATANHGLHRGSFQTTTTIFCESGASYQLAGWQDRNTMILTDGSTASFAGGAVNGDPIDHYEVYGLKYVPVKVKTADYDAFKSAYKVVENGEALFGGFGEGVLSSYSVTADVTANTNGLKTAVKNEDGSFSFTARANGAESGIKDTALKTADGITATVKPGNGSYGEFLRVDLNGNYGDLGANMQAVKWTYYGNDDTYTNAVQTYGTKFAADNWMHKSMGIQLGLSDSVRCKIPEGYDGTGYWTLTVYALGYADYTVQFQATESNMARPAGDADATPLTDIIAEAKALKEEDYTPESWAENYESIQNELQECEDMLENIAEQTQYGVDEQITHLREAIDKLVKVEYKYVYAGLTWEQYWAAEGVYEATNTSSSDVKDRHNEYDLGGFDTVTRATANHGLHRGSFQTTTTIFCESGASYQLAGWQDRNTMILTDGSTASFAGGAVNGDAIDHYEVYGLKYVPVKVKADDYEAFKSAYKVVENDEALFGGFGEGVLSSYSVTADVTANTNGLKTAVKNEDGTFSFKARVNGTESGIKDTALKTADGITATVKPGNGSYGEFLRVDLNGNYGDLGANMQAVKWTYYGNDDTYTNAVQTYGTKFAADNWMHKSMGIQLGLSDSVRCKIPEGYDGTGYWTLTVYALGYADYTVQFQATESNMARPAGDADATPLTDIIAEAKALKESDYTPESWAANYESIQNELQECEDMLENITEQTQYGVDEQITHLREAIDALVKAEFKLNATSGTLYTQDKTSTTLKVTTNLAGTVTWKSSNTKVATVDSKGVVTAKAAGTANITATLNGKTATYKVTVKNAMSINKTAVTVYVGGTPASYTLKATSAIGGTVKYATSNKSVATVSSKGVVTAKKAGTAVITATAGKAKITCKVTVKNPSIAAKAAKTTIYTKGQTSTTIAVTKSGVSGTAKFTSSNKSIATVDSKGVVRAKKAGTVKITVQVGKLKKVVTVAVRNASLKLSRTAATINRGKTTTIKVSAVPTGTVTYTSSNKGVATVTSKGVVKGVKKGTAVITVKCSGMTASFKVTVK